MIFINVYGNRNTSFLINKHGKLFGKGKNDEGQMGLGIKDNNQHDWQIIPFFEKKDIKLVGKTKIVTTHTLIYTENNSMKAS